MNAIQKQPVTFKEPFWEKISPQAKKFITRLLEKDPRKRYTADQALMDPFFEEEANKEEKQ